MIYREQLKVAQGEIAALKKELAALKKQTKARGTAIAYGLDNETDLQKRLDATEARVRRWHRRCMEARWAALVLYRCASSWVPDESPDALEEAIKIVASTAPNWKTPAMTVPILGLPGKAPYVLFLGNQCESCSGEDDLPLDEHDCGGYLYFDAEVFSYHFECERNTDHDEQIEGRWDDPDSGFWYTKEEVIKAAQRQRTKMESSSDG